MNQELNQDALPAMERVKSVAPLSGTINRSGWFVLPYTGWLVVFLLGPLLFILVTSFQEKGLWGGVRYQWNLDNYRRVADPLYLAVLWSSVQLALTTAASCLAVGYPMAWYMSRLSPAYRKWALLLVMLPFMSNFVVRAYAVKFLIGIEGPLNHLLIFSGLIRTPLFIDNPWFAVWFGMVTNYLPFLVLPLFVALERFDYQLVEASGDLGANGWQVWTKIVWPLTKNPAWTGFVLVFIPSLGEFVIPDLMGGAKTMYLGNLLVEQFLKSRDWPFGSALCVSMMVLVLIGAKLPTYFKGLLVKRLEPGE
jgi:spermidine/putrescine transport system permease protein